MPLAGIGAGAYTHAAALQLVAIISLPPFPPSLSLDLLNSQQRMTRVVHLPGACSWGQKLGSWTMNGDVRSSLRIFLPLYFFLKKTFMCVSIATLFLHHFPFRLCLLR